MKLKDKEKKKRRATPKFGLNGTTYGTKAERKTRNNHQNRKKSK